jgi:hypothetical protein
MRVVENNSSTSLAILCSTYASSSFSTKNFHFFDTIFTTPSSHGSYDFCYCSAFSELLLFSIPLYITLVHMYISRTLSLKIICVSTPTLAINFQLC